MGWSSGAGWNNEGWSRSAGGVIAPTTWDPGALATGIALSGGNLTATYTGASATNAMKANTTHSTGKFYFELTWPEVSGTRTSGIGNGAAGLNGYACGVNDINSIGWAGAGTVFFNGGTLATINAYGTPTCTIAIAVDLGGALIWFKDATSGNWNASGAANPATGTGGIALSVTGAPFFVMASLFASGDIVTANFGGSAYAYTPPAGFGNW